MIPKIVILSLAVVASYGQIEPRQATTCSSVPTWMTGDRIVGGQTASTAIPWQVSVRSGTSGSGHFCGGTILDSKTVLSAAHCFPNGLGNHYIMAGTVGRSDTSGQTIKIASLVSNTQMVYNSQTLNNDYIILKLESDLQFNNNVQPACLPSADYDPGTGKTCFVSGWGTLQSGANSLPANLQWVGVPTMTNTQCLQYYNSITNSMLCAGFQQGGKDSCQGDSGGPFICNEGGQAVITGVVSWGAGCAAPNAPGVYARVTTVLDWIKNNMESGSGSPPAPTPPSPQPPAPQPPTDGCGSPQWANDAFCDDENNNAACNWDGGACCDNDADGWNNYCNDCLCLEPTEPPTTAAPPTDGCGSPQWATDNFCDDENNNEACGYDGGACCGNTMDGWNNYCKDCACVDPNGGVTGTEPPCEDVWKTKKCQKRKNKGKCNKPKVAANCAKTCELC